MNRVLKEGGLIVGPLLFNPLHSNRPMFTPYSYQIGLSITYVAFKILLGQL